MPLPPGLELIHMKASSLQELARAAKLSSQARSLMAPGMSPSAYLRSLADQGLNRDAVSLLANGMEERRAVWWAAQSSRRVEGKLASGELGALKAAEDWCRGGASEAQLQDVLGKAQFQGPGSFAAQGALWSSRGACFDGAPLAPKAVEGSVHLAAAMEAGAPVPPPPEMIPEIPLASGIEPEPAVPVERPGVLEPPPSPPAPGAAQQAALDDALAPFVELGAKVAAGELPIG
jgi:hypothetical protein